MYLMGFDGRLGAGKTAGMSIFAQHYRQKTGCTLYSNYGLKHSKLITSFDMFLDVAQQPSSIICLDEAHTDLDSRSGNTNVAKYLTHMIFYLRKLRATLMFTSPNIGNIDARVRAIMDVYCSVSKDKQYFHYDMFDLNAERFLKSMRIKKEKALGIMDQVYDTHKMVVPMSFPDTKDEYNRILNLLKSISDDYYTKQAADAPGPTATEAAAV